MAHTRGKLSAEPRVPERLLGCLRPVVPAAAEVGHPVAKRTPGVHETGVVSGLLKQRQRLSRKPLQLVDVRIGRQPRAVEGGHGTGKGLTGLIPGGAGSLRSGVGDIDGFSVQLESLGEVEFERDIQPQRPRQVERSVEQPGGGTVVAPPERAPAGGGKSLARALRLRVIGLTELCLVADGLLEVVAENLIQLDQASAVRLQPAGESVVQLGPGRFRQRVVGSIPNQDVPEAKGVLSRKSRLLWANQLLADERREARSHLGLAREGLHRSAVEDLALDRSTFEYRSLRELQLVEASGEQGLQGRWHDHVAACLAGHRHHLGDEEGIAARGVDDVLAQVRRDHLRDQLVYMLLGERLEAKRDRPFRAAPDEVGAGHTEEQDGRAGREQRDVLDQVEEGLLRPVEVVEDADKRCLLLEQLAEGPGDLLGRGPLIRLAQQGAEGGCCGGIGRKRVELLQRLDHRPIGDPLPVGEAASLHDLGIDPGEELGREARLAYSGVADQRDKLAAALVVGTLPRLL